MQKIGLIANQDICIPLLPLLLPAAAPGAGPGPRVSSLLFGDLVCLLFGHIFEPLDPKLGFSYHCLITMSYQALCKIHQAPPLTNRAAYLTDRAP